MKYFLVVNIPNAGQIASIEFDSLDHARKAVETFEKSGTVLAIIGVNYDARYSHVFSIKAPT